MAEDWSLFGAPKKRVKEVRRHLRHWGIQPGYCWKSEVWRLTWQWARSIATSYVTKKRLRWHWPMPSEIATQYIMLLLAAMKEHRDLRLPPRAMDQMPDVVADRLRQSGQQLPPKQVALLPFMEQGS